jgi:hypothetical protein
MDSSNHPIGFSTGALAKGDFRGALQMLRTAGVSTVEISALRESELPLLAKSLNDLDLTGFGHVSIHAPSKFEALSEIEVVKLLGIAVERKLPVVVHPDTVRSPDRWRHFGNLMLIENLDKRKPCARTTFELAHTLSIFPDAGLCFDVAHARQVDPSMSEATQILRLFSPRLRQVHASGLSANSTHSRLSTAAAFAIGRISHLLPSGVPIILESPVVPEGIQSEIEFAQSAFSPWLDRLRADIDDVFDFKIPQLRRAQVVNFLKVLHSTNMKLSEFESIIRQLPTGSPFKPGEQLLNTQSLLARLSEPQKAALRQYLAERVNAAAQEFPDLRAEFRFQFS